jgi:hypothetical protein
MLWVRAQQPLDALLEVLGLLPGGIDADADLPERSVVGQDTSPLVSVRDSLRMHAAHPATRFQLKTS